MPKNTALLIYDNQECLKIYDVTVKWHKSVDLPIKKLSFNPKKIALYDDDTMLYLSTRNHFDINYFSTLAKARLATPGLNQVIIFDEANNAERYPIYTVNDMGYQKSIESINFDQATQKVTLSYDFKTYADQPNVYVVDPIVYGEPEHAWEIWRNMIDMIGNYRAWPDDNKFSSQELKDTSDIAKLYGIVLNYENMSNMSDENSLIYHLQQMPGTLYELFQKLEHPKFKDILINYRYLTDIPDDTLFGHINDNIERLRDQLIKMIQAAPVLND